jgi:hypothetical protein
MTERDWLATTDPTAMIGFLQGSGRAGRDHERDHHG